MAETALAQRGKTFDTLTILLRAGLQQGADLAEIPMLATDREVQQALKKSLAQHGMLGYCLPVISRMGGFEDQIVEGMRRRFRNGTTHRLQILGLGRRISSRLDRDGIAHIHLKGFSLSQRLFSDPAERSYTDVDMLVRIGDVLNVDQILKEMGCRPFNDLDRMSSTQRRLFCRLRHDIVYWDPTGRIKIEVHWRFNRARPLSEREYDDLFARQCNVPIGGWDVPSLSLEDEAGYLIDHGVKHGWLRLKWLYDIYVLSERYPPSILENISGVPGLSANIRDVRIAIGLSRHIFAGEAIADLTDDAGIAAEINRFYQMIAEQDLDMPLGEDPRISLQLLRGISVRDKLHRTLPALLNIPVWGVDPPPLGWWPLFALTGPISWLRRKGLLKN